MDLRLYILEAACHKVRLRPLRRILKANNIPFQPMDSLRRLRCILRQFVRSSKKGKRVQRVQQHREQVVREKSEKLDRIREQWPQLIQQNVKDKLVELFRYEEDRCLNC